MYLDRDLKCDLKRGHVTDHSYHQTWPRKEVRQRLWVCKRNLLSIIKDSKLIRSENRVIQTAAVRAGRGLTCTQHLTHCSLAQPVRTSQQNTRHVRSWKIGMAWGTQGEGALDCKSFKDGQKTEVSQLAALGGWPRSGPLTIKLKDYSVMHLGVPTSKSYWPVSSPNHS